MSQLGEPPPIPEPVDPDPPTWPTAIGVISTVVGSLGIICGVCTAVGSLATGRFMEWAAKMQAQGQGASRGAAMPTGPFPRELEPNALQAVSMLSTPLTSALLIVAGVALLRRRPVARTMHLAYAVASIAMTALYLVGSFLHQSAQQEFLARNPGDEWGKFMTQQQGGPAGALVGSAVTSCVYLVFPLFVLLWFLAIKRRPEDLGARSVEERLT